MATAKPTTPKTTADRVKAHREKLVESGGGRKTFELCADALLALARLSEHYDQSPTAVVNALLMKAGSTLDKPRKTR